MPDRWEKGEGLNSRENSLSPLFYIKEIRKKTGTDLFFDFYVLSTAAICRKFVMSRNGGAPNKRLYSRLNWEGLS